MPVAGELTFKNNENKESKYMLQHLQHRTPSEHIFDATERRLELQFTHFAFDGKKTNPAQQLILVLTFNLDPNAKNPLLESLVEANGQLKVGKAVSFPEFSSYMNRTSYFNFYAYEGSQTVPSCEENVLFLVVQQSLGATPAQIAAFESMLNDRDFKDGNTRLVQQVGDRKISMRVLPSLALTLLPSALAFIYLIH